MMSMLQSGYPLERCQSGRMGRIANPLYGLLRTEGSNPSLSANFHFYPE